MYSIPLFKNPSPSANPPLRFPQKLWKIANECQSGAVSWSPDGRSILLRYSLFREEYMSTKNELFKTDNISSFVRQLNLYGFRKVYDYTHKHASKSNSDLHEFSNSYFQRNRPDLLDKVSRKSGILKERNEFWPENLKPMDFADENSCDIKEGVITSNEVSDHSYLGTPEINGPEAEIADLILPEQKINVFVEAINDENKIPQATSSVSNENPPNTAPPASDCTKENTPLLPVKKKRGRKPGSKSKRLPSSFTTTRAQFYSPTLKNPEKFPSLMYFKDDKESIFLRNTSRDVMFSSTLPFQETPEYLELKETYDRLCITKDALYKHLL